MMTESQVGAGALAALARLRLLQCIEAFLKQKQKLSQLVSSKAADWVEGGGWDRTARELWSPSSMTGNPGVRWCVMVWLVDGT